MKIKQLLLVSAICFTTQNLLAQNEAVKNFGSLKLLGQYVVPHNKQFKGTTIGGLSGIDYDAKKKVYYMISDDRSAINPARFYTAKIFCTEKGIDSVAFVNVTTLRQKNGAAYPSNKTDPAHAPDPEALRYNRLLNKMIWTSEGERIVNAKDTILQNPAITVITADGKYASAFPVHENLKIHAVEKGPRQNGVFEGLTFDGSKKKLYISVEEPLYEDGPRADTMDNDAFIRILKFDVLSKNNIAQYAYKLDPVAYPATPSNAFKINGIPDILWIGNNKLLVLELSYSTGRLPFTIKLFIADLSNATNIINNPSLKENTSFAPASKKLLLNMDELGIYTDNIEGVTFGPILPNGHKTLLLVSDNNFQVFEQTQLFLFEIEP
jgi:hypothetical protein